MVKIKKIYKIILLLVLLFFASRALAKMSSSGYEIWLDTLDAGGGATNATNYQIDSNLGDFNASGSQSTTFKQKIAFSGIEEEPTVGFNVESVTLDFGELSPNSTGYSSHRFSAFTNAKEGYTIKVYGQSLHSDEYTITAIGGTAASSEPGTEQFGINLVSNSVPRLGEDPVGGIGQAAANYNQANKFAYNEGDTIAYSVSYSYQTDFTVTAIVNIADDTPAGSYATILTYEFIPVF